MRQKCATNRHFGSGLCRDPLGISAPQTSAEYEEGRKDVKGNGGRGGKREKGKGREGKRRGREEKGRKGKGREEVFHLLVV